jgi:hypothetical protein
MVDVLFLLLLDTQYSALNDLSCLLEFAAAVVILIRELIFCAVVVVDLLVVCRATENKQNSGQSRITSITTYSTVTRANRDYYYCNYFFSVHVYIQYALAKSLSRGVERTGNGSWSVRVLANCAPF